MVPVTSDTWWRDAQEELAVGRFLAAKWPRQAYHHAGQAVEFALKAIYMRRKGELPDELKTRRGHDLELVSKLAGLGPDIVQFSKRRACSANWLVVRDWNSNARFPGNRIPSQDVKELLTAVGHKPDGIMLWLETIYHKS